MKEGVKFGWKHPRMPCGLRKVCQGFEPELDNKGVSSFLGARNTSSEALLYEVTGRQLLVGGRA